MDKTDNKHHNSILVGLSKICALGMFVYMALLVLVFIHEKNWVHINSPYGYWFLVEVIGFVMVPMLMFAYAYRSHNTLIIKIAAIMTLIGILLNRMNISIICYRWEDTERYVPSWQEFIVTLTIVFIEIWVLRWIVRRMPVLRSGPK
jgi:Ni/Fe-hydrogenase subunit HybB-like protein